MKTFTFERSVYSEYRITAETEEEAWKQYMAITDYTCDDMAILTTVEATERNDEAENPLSQ